MRKYTKLYLLVIFAMKTSVLCSSEFVLNQRGRLVIDEFEAEMVNGDDIDRLNVLRTEYLNTNNFPREAHDLVRETRNLLNSSLNGFRFRPDSDQAKENLDIIRGHLATLQEVFPDSLEIFKDQKLANRLAFEEIMNFEKESYLDESLPGYCQNYPMLDKEAYQSFFEPGKAPTDQLACYETNNSKVGLSRQNLSDFMVSLEENAYEDMTSELKKDLKLKSLGGVLDQIKNFQGLTGDDSHSFTTLDRCARRDRKNGTALRDLIGKKKAEIAKAGETLNQAYTRQGLDRKRDLLLDQIKQGLILGNLFDIPNKINQLNYRGINDYAARNLSLQQLNSCHQKLKEDYQFISTDNLLSTLPSGMLFDGCRDTHPESETDALNCFRASQTALEDCYKSEIGQDVDLTKYSAEAFMPLITAKVNSNPLLVDRSDAINLVPFTQSESKYVPSELTKKILSLPGAADLSDKIVAKIIENPARLNEAIDELLAAPENAPLVDGLVGQALESESLNETLNKEIRDYQDELMDSAESICQKGDESLHHFPSLVKQVLADRINDNPDPKVVAELEAAHCWLLRNEPPDDGGFSAVTVIGGAGALALSLVNPAAGFVAATALGLFDGIQNNEQAYHDYQVAFGVHSSGWGNTQDLLLKAGRLTDSRVMLGFETALAGIDRLRMGGAGMRARTGARTLSSGLTDSAPVLNRTRQAEFLEINRYQVPGERASIISTTREFAEVIAGVPDRLKQQVIKLIDAIKKRFPGKGNREIAEEVDMVLNSCRVRR